MNTRCEIHDATAPLIGASRVMRRLRADIHRIAATDLPVLIQGPTGSGKELVARALHLASGRSGALVAVNVCAISDAMFEDALFGHVRGAFTGALHDARGYLAEADRGTLFLDEIGGLPLQAQAKLLRAIETREFRPVGAKADRRSGFRAVTATNDDIEALVTAGGFRADLAERLRTITLDVPPLRERREDVPALVAYFAAQAAMQWDTAVEFTAAALDVLQSHDWPRNVRELRNVVERALAWSGVPLVGADAVRSALPARAVAATMDDGTFLRRRLVAVLDACGWDTSRAATRLGVNRATVYRRMQRLGIPRRSTGQGAMRDLGHSHSHDSAATT